MEDQTSNNEVSLSTEAIIPSDFVRLENIYGTIRRVTAAPTWTPASKLQDAIAYDTTHKILYVFNFVTNVWDSTATPATTPGGSNTQVQFNDSGAFNGASALTYNKSTTKTTIGSFESAAQTYTPAGGATATLDLSLANEHRITMPAGNITIALSNDTNAQKFMIEITQDSGGSRTVTWFSGIKWQNGTTPTLTTTASKTDVFGFTRLGSGSYLGFVMGQNM